MPTKQLYLFDSYLKQFEGRVEKITENQVVLDQTAFHPLTGGVASDTGHLIKNETSKYDVVRVEINKETKEIAHVLKETPDSFKLGDTVKGLVDWERRHRLMRLHTAAHVIAAIMYGDHNALITGGQVDPQYAKLDFNLPVTERQIFEAAVERANVEVARGLELKTYFLAKDDALKIPGIVKLAERMPPEEKELRIVEISGIDLQADGGPHVKNTNEIGRIQLIKIENKGKNQRRAYFNVE